MDRIARADIIGAWQPVTLLGVDVVGKIQRIGTTPLMVFDSGRGLGWSAFNGCQHTGGGLRIDSSGGFSAIEGSVHHGNCDESGLRRTATVEVVTDARRMRITGEELTLYAADGSLLGSFSRRVPTH